MPYRLPHTTRILVVEDQHRVRQIVVRCLRAEGYEVLKAGNGEEALIVLESDLGIDMVVTDVRMPGRRLLSQAAAHRRDEGR
jgi:CheY-like chemotaxis protein